MRSNFHFIWMSSTLPDKRTVSLGSWWELYRSKFDDPRKVHRISAGRGEIDKINIKVAREGEEMSFSLADTLKTSRGSRNSPYAKEIREEVNEYLKTRPELQHSRLQALFEELGYKLVFTPPYTPSVQPIELVWAYMKHCVSDSFRPGRTMLETLRDIHDGFYGCEEEDGREAHEGPGGHWGPMCEFHNENSPTHQSSSKQTLRSPGQSHLSWLMILLSPKQSCNEFKM